MRNSPENERQKISKDYMKVFDAELLKADQDIILILVLHHNTTTSGNYTITYNVSIVS